MQIKKVFLEAISLFFRIQLIRLLIFSLIFAIYVSEVAGFFLILIEGGVEYFIYSFPGYIILIIFTISISKLNFLSLTYKILISEVVFFGILFFIGSKYFTDYNDMIDSNISLKATLRNMCDEGFRFFSILISYSIFIILFFIKVTYPERAL
ncbi:MAG: hypothetical protein ABI851_01480 [Saprospiraceae bacterium]